LTISISKIASWYCWLLRFRWFPLDRWAY